MPSFQNFVNRHDTLGIYVLLSDGEVAQIRLDEHNRYISRTSHPCSDMNDVTRSYVVDHVLSAFRSAGRAYESSYHMGLLFPT